MLGTFDFRILGRFIVSGETPEAFLWDLFDQIACDASMVTPLAGATVIMPRPNDDSGDEGDRVRFRGSPEWRRMHNEHFASILTDGFALVQLNLPADSFFELHLARLVGLVDNHTYSSYQSLDYNAFVSAKFGPNSPAYEAAMAAKPSQGYPHDTLEPVSVLNHLMLKKLLVLQNTGHPLPVGLLTQTEVESQLEARAEARRSMVEETKQLLLSRIKPRKPRKKPVS